LPRDREGDGREIPGERVAGEALFRPEPEPLGRSYSWDEELERQRDLQFNRFYAPRAPRPTAPFNKYRSLRRV
jgi:hypothetical protein